MASAGPGAVLCKDAFCIPLKKTKFVFISAGAFLLDFISFCVHSTCNFPT